MDFDQFLGEMQKLLVASQQGSLFGNKAAHGTACEKVCVDYLKGQGYSISEPHNYPTKATRLDDLIKMFYGYVEECYPKHLWTTENIKKDRAVAKAFVERRMKDDHINKKTALDQCAYIIGTIFKRSDVFKFDSPPNFGILGQGEMAWVTSRAVQLVNKELVEGEKIANEKAVRKATEEIHKNYPKLGHSLGELEAMTKKLEAQYGKKEKGNGTRKR